MTTQVKLSSETKLSSKKQMHKIVWIMLGVFGLFVASFPVAMTRVSHSEKFDGSHIKSMTIEGKLDK